MDPITMSAIIGSGTGILKGIGDWIFDSKQADRDKEIADQNYAQQQATLDWQKSAQQTTWQREDSAMQRRVQDLKSAGLSPVLAAGSAASTSAPTNVITPQRESTQIARPKMNNIMDSIAAMNQVAMSKAQIDLIRAQTKLADANAENSYQNIDLNQRMFDARIKDLGASVLQRGSSKSLMDVNRDTLARDLYFYSKEEGINPRYGGISKEINQFMRMLGLDKTLRERVFGPSEEKKLEGEGNIRGYLNKLPPKGLLK